MKNESGLISQNENKLPTLPNKTSSAAKATQQSTPNRITPESLSGGAAILNQTIKNETIVRDHNGYPANNPYSQYFSKRKEKQKVQQYGEFKSHPTNSQQHLAAYRGRNSNSQLGVGSSASNSAKQLSLVSIGVQPGQAGLNALKSKSSAELIQIGNTSQAYPYKQQQNYPKNENVPDNHQNIYTSSVIAKKASLSHQKSLQKNAAGAAASQDSLIHRNQLNQMSQLNVIGMSHMGKISVEADNKVNDLSNHKDLDQQRKEANISNISTNPSSSQIQVRSQFRNDRLPKSEQRAGGLAQKYTLNPSKPIAVLNKRYMQNEPLMSKKASTGSQNQGYDKGQIDSRQSPLGQSQSGQLIITRSKSKLNNIDAIKNIYGRNQQSQSSSNAPNPNREANTDAQNSYSYFQAKSRTKNPFGASRNSQLGQASSGAAAGATNGTSMSSSKLSKGGFNNTSTFNVYLNNQSHPNINQHKHLQNPRGQIKNNGSNKNSYQNTKTSFGMKSSVSNNQNSNKKHQQKMNELQTMEVRGKNQASSQQQGIPVNDKLKNNTGVEQNKPNAAQPKEGSPNNKIKQAIGPQMNLSELCEPQDSEPLDNSIHQYFGLMQQKQQQQLQELTIQRQQQSQQVAQNNSCIDQMGSLFALEGKGNNLHKSERKEPKPHPNALMGKTGQLHGASAVSLAETGAAQERQTDAGTVKMTKTEQSDEIENGIEYFQKQGKMMKQQMKSQQQKSRKPKLNIPQYVNNSSSASRVIRRDKGEQISSASILKKEQDSLSMHMQSLPQIGKQQNSESRSIKLKARIMKYNAGQDFRNDELNQIDRSSSQSRVQQRDNMNQLQTNNDLQEANMSLKDELNPDDQEGFIGNNPVFDAYGGQNVCHAATPQLSRQELPKAAQDNMLNDNAISTIQYNSRPINFEDNANKLHRFQDLQFQNHKSFDNSNQGPAMAAFEGLDRIQGNATVLDGSIPHSFAHNDTVKYGVKKLHTENNRSLQENDSSKGSPQFTIGAASFSSMERLHRREHHNIGQLNNAHRQDLQNLSQQPPLDRERLDSNDTPSTHHQRNYNGIQLAPLHGVRDNFGMSPGTANTHGGVQRHNYKQINHKKMQYKLPSQQCQSEMYHMNNHYRNADELNGAVQNNNFNMESHLDESIDNLLDHGNFKNGNDLDPKEDMENIPSIHTININRIQRSQATNRTNYHKINNILTNYQNLNHQPADQATSEAQLAIQRQCSQSESLTNKQDFHRVQNLGIHQNDINMQASQISQISQGSYLSNEQIFDQRTMVVNNNNSYLSKRETTSQDREQHPFSGPKLHLYRKGQSKSSQSKLRKIKVSHQQQNQIVIDISSQANYSNIQQNGNESIHNKVNTNQSSQKQFSDGGAMYQMQRNRKIENRKKDGLINIQEILNANQQGVNYLNADRMYTDLRSQNSHGLLSQNSNDLGFIGGIQAKDGPELEDPNLLDNVDNNSSHLQQPQLQGRHQNTFDGRDPNGGNQIVSNMNEGQKDIQQILSKELSHQNSSKFSTIQQSACKNSLDGPTNYTNNQITDSQVNSGSRNTPLAQQQIDNTMNSPYNATNSDSIQRLVGALAQKHQYQTSGDDTESPQKNQRDQLIDKIQDRQREGMRPHSTALQDINGQHGDVNRNDIIQDQLRTAYNHTDASNPTGSMVSNISNLGPNKTALKPLTTPAAYPQTFQHPKVGKNSKHPLVFKNHGTLSQQQIIQKINSSKNLSRQIVSNKLISACMSGPNLKIDNQSDAHADEMDPQEISQMSIRNRSSAKNCFHSQGQISIDNSQNVKLPQDNMYASNCSAESKHSKRQLLVKSKNSTDEEQNLNYQTTFKNFNVCRSDRLSDKDSQRHGNIQQDQAELGELQNPSENFQNLQNVNSAQKSSGRASNKEDGVRFIEQVTKQKRRVKQSSGESNESPTNSNAQQIAVEDSINNLQVQILRDQKYQRDKQAYLQSSFQNDNKVEAQYPRTQGRIPQVKKKTPGLKQRALMNQKRQQNVPQGAADPNAKSGQMGRVTEPLAQGGAGGEADGEVNIDESSDGRLRPHEGQREGNGKIQTIDASRTSDSLIEYNESSTAGPNGKIENVESARFGANQIMANSMSNDNLQQSMSNQNLGNTGNQSHSIAQTPCFAETPNTTDQFEGYKIDIRDQVFGANNAMPSINWLGSLSSNGPTN